MAFKIIAVFLLFLLVVSKIYKLVNIGRDFEEETEEEISYELIDSIASMRERAKGIEDCITYSEMYSQGECERMIQISWIDAAGDQSFETFVSEEFIDYLYSEREKVRDNLKRKINPFKN